MRAPDGIVGAWLEIDWAKTVPSGGMLTYSTAWFEQRMCSLCIDIIVMLNWLSEGFALVFEPDLTVPRDERGLLMRFLLASASNLLRRF